jgi:REP-associated tyrosine transposase
MSKPSKGGKNTLHSAFTDRSNNVSIDKTLGSTGKFKNKYRISSIRLPYWDYSQAATYFITICTKNRIPYFGHIQGDVMVLSDIGEMAKKYWLEIPNHFPFAKLDAFVVMPDHIHGIIIIDKPIERRDAINRVPTDNDTENDTVTEPINTGGCTGNKNPMLNDNLSRIIRWYKGRVSFESHKIRSDFSWQSRFYEHIIRNEKSFYRISNYIINNPLHWQKDD